MVINKKGSAKPADDVQGDTGSQGALGGPPGKGICLQLLPSDILAMQSRCFVCDILQLTVTHSLV